MNSLKVITLGILILISTTGSIATGQDQSVKRLFLSDGWMLKSSALIREDGNRISTTEYKPQQWLKIIVPTTVLNALVKNGIYPDPRIGLNLFRIPDSSDEFNKKHDLTKYSYLPEKRNPWRDPYWYRTEFTIHELPRGRCLWLEFKGINYKADVWLNGKQVTDSKTMVGIYQRFRFNVTEYVQKGKNCLAVRIHPVDHPGDPDTQLQPLGPSRTYFKKEIQKDVTYTVGIGYDCMPSIPDRNMGIWQEVFLEWTGPVDIRNPFIAADLPLPDTSFTTLSVSAELVNTIGSPLSGLLRGRITGTDVSFEQPVKLAPNETKLVHVDTRPVMQYPQLWWPVNYGRQHLYEFKLEFEFRDAGLSEAGTTDISDLETIMFGVREITRELYWLKDVPGLRIHINGQKVFSQGGWLQPELLFDMPGKRMETEVRHLTNANLNTVTVEDLPFLTDEFLDACDRLGLMFWMSFFSTYWVAPETNWPLDHHLLAQCSIDVIKRNRNHPSLVLYSCVGEGAPSEDIYLTWRKNLLSLDSTRLFIPTIDTRQVFKWYEKDLPTGTHDAGTFWDISPPGYYQRVRDGKKWMFNTETSIASLPPVNNLNKFIPDLLKESCSVSEPNPVDASWAHHDASQYLRDYDPAIRIYYGTPNNVVDYCWRAQLLSAERHRAWSEAVNHRMWDITSGVWQWKLNSCWPSVGWQIYDWYLKPLVSSYYYKSAFEPLHIQLSPLDGMVTIINRRLMPVANLEALVSVYDSNMNLRWEQRTASSIGANTYKNLFSIPPLRELGDVYFVKLRANRDSKKVSENFYWLSSKPYAADDHEAWPRGGFNLFSASNTADFSELNELPMVKLNVEYHIEFHGDKSIVKVSLENPTDQLAFFIQLALTKGHNGEEVLPIFWGDNYFSLLPHESREITGKFDAGDLGNITPVLEVGGWNIFTDYQCDYLKPSGTIVNMGENFTVTAGILNTFIDGSRVLLFMDKKPMITRWAWNRGGKSTEITFNLIMKEPGKHVLSISKQSITVDVK